MRLAVNHLPLTVRPAFTLLKLAGKVIINFSLIFHFVRFLHVIFFFNFPLKCVILRMDHYMPEIFWHDRQALLSVDVFPRLVNDKYRIATSSVQKEVRNFE